MLSRGISRILDPRRRRPHPISGRVRVRRRDRDRPCSASRSTTPPRHWRRLRRLGPGDVHHVLRVRVVRCVHPQRTRVQMDRIAPRRSAIVRRRLDPVPRRISCARQIIRRELRSRRLHHVLARCWRRRNIPAPNSLAGTSPVIKSALPEIPASMYCLGAACRGAEGFPTNVIGPVTPPAVDR